MSRLKFPLKEGLRDPADEAAVSRMWQSIDSRFPRQRRRLSASIIFAPAIAVAAGVALVAFLRHDAGPLRLANGNAIVAVNAPATGLHLALSDGSSVELGPGARFEPIESSASTFIAVLDQGDASFDVRPGGPRRWQIECGLATVEVVGTRFSCDRAPDRLHVGVERGVVLVRGERVPNRVRRLAAGESLDVFDARVAPSATERRTSGSGATAEPALVPEPAPSVIDEAAAPEPAARPRGRAAAGRGWRELARSGHHREAFATLGEQGFRREVKRLGIADLFALADVARLSGHPADAVVPLQRIIDGFASDPQAPLAAFALGRLELDDLGRPGPAAAAFKRALELGPPQSLRENVRARLEEAQARLRAGAQ
ncbi:MAG TPA: FecR domain-containing protein [Polyangia bacterium]|jgi:transmembrane sensor